jgi:hypothetical protein
MGLEYSSGNVFLDMGFPPAEAERLKREAEEKIKAEIEEAEKDDAEETD